MPSCLPPQQEVSQVANLGIKVHAGNPQEISSRTCWAIAAQVKAKSLLSASLHSATDDTQSLSTFPYVGRTQRFQQTPNRQSRGLQLTANKTTLLSVYVDMKGPSVAENFAPPNSSGQISGWGSWITSRIVRIVDLEAYGQLIC